MCLAIPGKVLELNGSNALVDFDGVKRKVVIGLCNGVKIGTYVIVHAGYAIETINEKEARETVELWREIIEKEDFGKEDII
ncbi:MAG: HypC/HybG/HupF family hydrogenase formation chaperone [Promethearchaeota archaeon]